LEPAEALSAQADFLLSTGNRDAALNVLRKAEKLNAGLAVVHEGLGNYHYQNSAFDEAEKEFNAALQSNPDDWIAFFFKAHILLKRSGYTDETVQQIRAYLEKTLALVPDLAPAHGFLCMAYLKAPETRAKAIFEAKRATELEPGNLAYFIDLGKALQANGRIEEAKRVGERAQKSASTGREREIAANFARQLRLNGKDPEPDTALDIGAGDNQSATMNNAKITSLEGQITELICGHPPQVMLTITNPSSQVLLHVKDISAIKMELQGAELNSAFACPEWMNRKVKVTFSEMGDANPGEIQSINFE
jgi:tetratricopeptide (TPR) repeat protein